jgi:putative ABC transport system permease protein
MNVVSHTRIALGALRVNKLRSVLTMLGVVIGVAAVITMVAVGAGARARVAEQIQSMGSNLILVWAGSATVSGVRLGAGTQPTVTEDDAWAIRREVPLVAAVAPFSTSQAMIVHGNQNWVTMLVAVTPEFLDVREWDVVAGRGITQDEVDAAAKVAVVGATVAERLFGEDDPVGRLIRVQNVPFIVVGVLDRKGQSTWGKDQDDKILIPLSTARLNVQGRNRARGHAVESISVRVRERDLMKAAEQEIRGVLRQRHRLQATQEDDFVLRNMVEVLESQESSSRVLSILLAAIAGVSLFVGGIGIMNIMLVSVTERTREIGIRVAVGARPRDIQAQFLLEAVTLSLLGGVVGIALGVAGAYATAHFAQWPIVIQAQAVLLAFSFAVAVGVCFGLYPARKAARLDPIDALRYE